MSFTKCKNEVATEQLKKTLIDNKLPKLILLTRATNSIKDKEPNKEIKIVESKQTNQNESIYDDKSPNCSGTENIKFDYILTQSNDPDMNNLFTDDLLTFEVTNNHFILPDSNKMNKLKYKLDSILPINPNEIKLIVNASVALNNLITTKEDELNEGNKIMMWLKRELDTPENDIIKGMKIYIHNGYVHIIREGLGCMSPNALKKGILSGKDIITEYLVPDLKYFRWQYGLEIDYKTLKYILFNNNYQKKLKQDNQEQKEAERILSQEYLVVLQPEPIYIMWFLKRLIQCWFADIDVQNNIRKIKVLINLYRAKGNEQYNKNHGILPIIVIYPRYGIKSAEIVLKKISYYFWKYITKGWSCSLPTYFIKINELLYYNNANNDLKMYFKNVIKNSNNSLKNNTFNDKYTYIKDVSKII